VPVPFPRKLDAYRAGDTRVQREFLADVEPVLRGMVRRSMGRDLRAMEESVDISQTLLLALHMRLERGQVEFEDESDLRAYLHAMVRHKLANRSAKAKAEKRGGGKQPASLDAAPRQGDEGPRPAPAEDLTASVVMQVTEMQERIKAELSDEERRIFEGRLEGRSFAEIADATGSTPDAVRMAWSRARKRLLKRGLLQGWRQIG